MKALSIHQPFASLIATGEKWVENRAWSTSYRGPLAIHASKGSRYLEREELKQYPTGVIVAVARLDDCRSIEWLENEARNREIGTAGMLVDHVLDHPHTEGPWCWILSNVVALDQPIPYRGAQGLFEVPDQTIELKGFIP